MTDGEVSFYGGSHDQDSGDTLDANRALCSTQRGCAPDGSPPFIRLAPYADTTNPGGVYILAICSLAEGYPVEPRDCKYHAFKVKEGKGTYEFMLKGRKSCEEDDYGLSGWEIQITGTGFAGESIDAIATTAIDGYSGGCSDFSVNYTFNAHDTVVPAQLEVCEIQQPGWTQAYPPADACYELTIDPAAMAFVGDLDFRNSDQY